jgi:plastocyanin
VTIGNFQYAMPSGVQPGARIAIYNVDSVAHTLTIASAGIDVVVAADGAAYMTAPSAPGSYLVTCDYHADMTATLLVK